MICYLHLKATERKGEKSGSEYCPEAPMERRNASQQQGGCVPCIYEQPRCEEVAGASVKGRVQISAWVCCCPDAVEFTLVPTNKTSHSFAELIPVILCEMLEGFTRE